MAIQTGDETLYYPDAKTDLNAGDRLLAVGDWDELMMNQGMIKGAYHHWVTLAQDSTLLGMKIADLHNQYNLLVQAVRRQGKLDYKVDPGMELHHGDCLLLQGERNFTLEVAKLAINQ
jgi:monovalent cation:H+ antiporter-2, CPA2 family